MCQYSRNGTIPRQEQPSAQAPCGDRRLGVTCRLWRSRLAAPSAMQACAGRQRRLTLVTVDCRLDPSGSAVRYGGACGRDIEGAVPAGTARTGCGSSCARDEESSTAMTDGGRKPDRIGVDRSEGFGERLLGVLLDRAHEMPPELIAPLVAEEVARVRGAGGLHPPAGLRTGTAGAAPGPKAESRQPRACRGLPGRRGVPEPQNGRGAAGRQRADVPAAAGRQRPDRGDGRHSGQGR